MVDKGGSDLHLMVGVPPKARVSGSISRSATSRSTRPAMERLLKEIVPERRWKDYLERRDLDLAHEIEGFARFRGNFLYNHWGQAAVFRQIPAKILSFEELKLPEAIKKLCHLNEGLVVVTGPTGSGKSTTLAAMIDYINTNLAGTSSRSRTRSSSCTR
jgi:twitching motility protein PilT